MFVKKAEDGAWPKKEVYTTFSMKAAIPHLDALIATVPEGASVGVISDLGALDFGDHAVAQLEATGRSTGARTVLPQFDRAVPTLVDPLIVQFLETMLKNKQRYIIAMLGAAENYAALVCNIWRMGAQRAFVGLSNNPTLYG